VPVGLPGGEHRPPRSWPRQRRSDSADREASNRSREPDEPISVSGLPDVAQFRAARSQTALRSSDTFLASDRWSTQRVAHAEKILASGWQLGSMPQVQLIPPVDWDNVCGTNRSWHYHLHAWEPMAIPICVYDHTGRREFLDYCVQLALDWVARHSTVDHDVAFAWYDMAVGLRAYRLGYLLDVVARDPMRPGDQVESLLRAAIVHAEELARDGGFARHTNHGLYQAVGQLSLATRFREVPALAAARVQAELRLEEMIYQQFTIEGIHREHSPGYHFLVLDTVERAVDSGLVTRSETLELVDRVREGLAWLTMPDGRLAMIGDTSPHSVRGDRFGETPNGPLRFVVSGGHTGTAPAERMRAYPQTGFAFMRDRWPSGPADFEDCTYLAQICAFHSRAHKHADDLSFVWYERHRELLVDSGRYGYVGKLDPASELGKEGFYYSDPNRMYVETTRAHNTVEIDGRSYQRKGVVPYGSALRHWGDHQGIMYSAAEVTHFDTVAHRRTLMYRPREWLLVIDLLNDTAGSAHHFSQRFHFAPELTVTRLNDGSAAADLPEGEGRLFMTTLSAHELGEVACGQQEPSLLGFISREMMKIVPAATVAFAASGATAGFATHFCFAASAPVDMQSTLGTDGTGTLRWLSDGMRREIAIERGLLCEAPLSFVYADAPAMPPGFTDETRCIVP
jgi:hypothetical protein